MEVTKLAIVLDAPNRNPIALVTINNETLIREAARVAVSEADELAQRETNPVVRGLRLDEAQRLRGAFAALGIGGELSELPVM